MDTLTAPATGATSERRLPFPRRSDGGRVPVGRTPGLVTAALSVLVAGLLVLHAAVPNTLGHLGSLLESFLPWLGLGVPPLLGLALLRRSKLALIALPLPVAAWFGLFAGVLAPHADEPFDLTVVQHNVSDENPDPAGTIGALLAVSPDLVALEEVTEQAMAEYAAALAPLYPHAAVQGTVGLWSKYPVTDVRVVEIRPRAIVDDWSRGMRATVALPQGDVAVYVAHLPSLRLGWTDGFGSTRRDGSAEKLGAALAAEPQQRVLLLGDLNGTLDDRGLDPVTSRLGSDRSDFAFSWPAQAPLARIDHVLARAATVTRVWSLPRTGSDHLPVAARIRF
ncbi:endonuclease/exonuclease/phosphatase family protein [Catellatospora vulcania]|uniref:endonuclease/exonuclease/phosphatase family protein n=1 Tax=Catellatospora vulcania TaxID=1460450 RepID=UPI001E30E57D|nr:endonuclease/exonuclease/phosphatase family protein [Catellatospora vulcania]